MRGLLGEHGTVIARAIQNARRRIAEIVGGSGDGLSDLVRTLLSELYEELHELDRRITIYDRRIRELYRNSELCQRLGRIEGIGPVTVTALSLPLGLDLYRNSDPGEVVPTWSASANVVIAICGA
jgi:transposase